LFALGLFGLVLEARIGPTRFFWLFILSGIIINIIPYYQRSLGASGAIYAILGTLTLLRPWMTVWVSGIPMPMIIAGGVWLTQDTIGVFVPSNVGNLAHITGLLIGICMGLIWRNYRDIPTRKQKKDKKLEKQLDKWEREHMKRND
jgi:uncharacterized protein